MLKLLKEVRPCNYDEFVIVPFRADDLEKFLEYFYSNRQKVNDHTCLLFSSDKHFMVYKVTDKETFLQCSE